MFDKKWIVLFMVLVMLALLTVATVRAGSPAQPTDLQGLAPQALVGNAFTYQGQLKRSGKPVTGDCDVAFRLYDQETLGSEVGSPITAAVPIIDGLFTVPLDFGAMAFTGDARWLNVQVMCPGDAGFDDLGRQPLTPAPYALALPGLWIRQRAFSPNLIGGYAGNVISDTVAGGTIGGGGHSLSIQRVTGGYGTVGGGSGNVAGGSHATVGGGNSNIASGTYSTIGGGANNTANGVQRATVGGGGHNSASGYYATVAGGNLNTASGAYAAVAGGSDADASHYGEFALAGGRFSYPGAGQAQTSVYVLRRTTTSGTATDLFLDGDTAMQSLTVAAGRTVTFDILVVARTEAGASAGYQFLGVIENQGGTTGFIGTPQKTVLGEDVASWDVNVIADNANDALVIRVTGAAATTVRWVATARTVEVAW